MYVLKEKFKLPLASRAPRYSKKLTILQATVLTLGLALALTGIFTIYWGFVTLGVALLTIALLGALVRRLYHERHVKRYYAALEQKWLLSEGFIELRDFLLLLGLPKDYAFEVTNNFGVSILAGEGYQIARGYQLLKDSSGEATITAVEIGGEKTAKDKLRITAKILPSALTI